MQFPNSCIVRRERRRRARSLGVVAAQDSREVQWVLCRRTSRFGGQFAAGLDPRPSSRNNYNGHAIRHQRHGPRTAHCICPPWWASFVFTEAAFTWRATPHSPVRDRHYPARAYMPLRELAWEFEVEVNSNYTKARVHTQPTGSANRTCRSPS